MLIRILNGSKQELKKNIFDLNDFCTPSIENRKSFFGLFLKSGFRSTASKLTRQFDQCQKQNENNLPHLSFKWRRKQTTKLELFD
jgi:hypothetical protein